MGLFTPRRGAILHGELRLSCTGKGICMEKSAYFIRRRGTILHLEGCIFCKVKWAFFKPKGFIVYGRGMLIVFGEGGLFHAEKGAYIARKRGPIVHKGCTICTEKEFFLACRRGCISRLKVFTFCTEKVAQFALRKGRLF